jgi:hypothetical protein
MTRSILSLVALPFALTLFAGCATETTDDAASGASAATGTEGVKAVTINAPTADFSQGVPANASSTEEYQASHNRRPSQWGVRGDRLFIRIGAGYPNANDAREQIFESQGPRSIDLSGHRDDERVYAQLGDNYSDAVVNPLSNQYTVKQILGKTCDVALRRVNVAPAGKEAKFEPRAFLDCK